MICTFRISFLVAEKRLINVFPSVRNQFSFQPTSYLALFFSQIQTWMTRLFTSRRTPNLPCHLRSAIKIWWTCYSHRYENHLKRVFIPQLEVNWSNVSCTNWPKSTIPSQSPLPLTQTIIYSPLCNFTFFPSYSSWLGKPIISRDPTSSKSSYSSHGSNTSRFTARFSVNSLRKYMSFMSVIHFFPTTTQSEFHTATDGNDELQGPQIIEIGSSETASDTADSESTETVTKVCHDEGCSIACYTNLPKFVVVCMGNCGCMYG